MKNDLPRWVDFGLLPFINLTIAFAVSGLVVMFVGENPIDAAYLLLRGSLGYGEGMGYTLYYATNFIFTGLAVAVAFHCGLFNIGGEGQAYLGGLGVALACLAFDRILPWYLTFPIAILGGALFGGLWALIPAWLQAKRGSHIVITTIMFNFIASALMVFMMNAYLQDDPTKGSVSRTFESGAHIPKLDWLFAIIGVDMGVAPANISFLVALVAAVFVWVLIWRTRLGYEMRTMGTNPTAAKYAGIPTTKIIIIAMMISGALAGLMALNPVMGEQQRLFLDVPLGGGICWHCGGTDGPFSSSRYYSSRHIIWNALSRWRGAGV